LTPLVEGGGGFGGSPASSGDLEIVWVLLVFSKFPRVLFVKWGCTVLLVNTSPYFHKKEYMFQ
jgi:hypothetical protein